MVPAAMIALVLNNRVTRWVIFQFPHWDLCSLWYQLKRMSISTGEDCNFGAVSCKCIINVLLHRIIST